MDITFHPLQEKYFAFIHDWFNQPHIQAFYSLRTWTYQEVVDKFIPYISGAIL